MKTHDVVIIGGGVIGSSVACWLAADPDFDGSVVVVERDPSYRNSSTARSNSCIRQQFSTPENIEISRFGIHFIKNVGDYLSVDGERPELSFVESGYLFLADSGNEAALRNTLRILECQGVDDVEWRSVAQLQDQYPWLNTDAMTGATLGIRNEGWFDPFSLLQAFKRKAQSLGVEYISAEVTGMRREQGCITRVDTQASGTLACGAVVNAAGPRARFVANMAGLDVPVSPRKRDVFVFQCRQEVPIEPLVIDPRGLYFRREGQYFICGRQPAADKDPESLGLDVDHEFFEATLWPQLAALVPAFEAIKPVNAWAGHYALNLADQNALLGPLPEVENLYFANGFSGHGMQQSPAVGRAISELMVHGRFRTLDLTRLLAARLVTSDLLREAYVV